MNPIARAFLRVASESASPTLITSTEAPCFSLRNNTFCKIRIFWKFFKNHQKYHQKWCQNPSKNHQQINKKSKCQKVSENDPKMMQNGTNMEPKWVPGTVFFEFGETLFLNNTPSIISDFRVWEAPGWLKNRQKTIHIYSGAVRVPSALFRTSREAPGWGVPLEKTSEIDPKIIREKVARHRC